MIERVRSWIQDAEMCLLSRVAGLSLRHWLYFPLSLRGSELCKFCHQSVSKRVRADLPIFVTTWTRLQRIYNWPTAHVAQAACLKQTSGYTHPNHTTGWVSWTYRGSLKWLFLHVNGSQMRCHLVRMTPPWRFSRQARLGRDPGLLSEVSEEIMCVISDLPYLLFYDFWSVTSLIYQFI